MVHHFVQHAVFRARRSFAGQRQEQAHVGTSDADACSPVARVNAVAGDEVPVKDFIFHALHAVADGRKHGVVPVAQPVFAQEDARGSLGDGPPALGAGEGDVLSRFFNGGVILRVARGHQGQAGPACIIMVAAVAARAFPGAVLALLGRQPFAHHVDYRLALGAIFGEAEGIGTKLGDFEGDVFHIFLHCVRQGGGAAHLYGHAHGGGPPGGSRSFKVPVTLGDIKDQGRDGVRLPYFAFGVVPGFSVTHGVLLGFGQRNGSAGAFQPQIRPFEAVAADAVAAVIHAQAHLLAALYRNGKGNGLFSLFLPEDFLPEGLDALDFFHAFRGNEVQGDFSGSFRLVHQKARVHVQAAPVLMLIRAVKHVQALRRFEEVSVNAQDQVTFLDIFFGRGTLNHLGDRVKVRHGFPVGVQHGFGEEAAEVRVRPGGVQAAGAEAQRAEGGDPAFGYFLGVAEPARVQLCVLFSPLVQRHGLGEFFHIGVHIPHIGRLPGGFPARTHYGRRFGGGLFRL